MTALAHDLAPKRPAEPRSRPDFAALAGALTAAEQMVVTAIERECEAVRHGKMRAAWALHESLKEAARAYIAASNAARASLPLLHYEDLARSWLEERRLAFAATLKVEFAVLATLREDAGRR